MIRINLLPHREAARKRRRELFYVALGSAAGAGLLIAGAIYLWFANEIDNQQQRNATLQSEIARFDTQIKDIAGLQAEIAALRARQQAVEDLQADRNTPVHLFNDLVKLLPDGVYLSSLRQDGATVTLGGSAQSNERVSELLRNLGSGSPWLSRPELVEIVAGTVTLAPRDSRRVANFVVRVRLGRPVEPARSTASGALGAASGSASAAVAASATRPAASGGK